MAMERSAVGEYDVTAYHIRRGFRRSSDRCPVALCLRKARPRLAVSVGVRCISVGDYKFVPTKALEDWVSAFDSGEQVRPFRLTLSLLPGQAHGMADCVPIDVLDGGD